METVLLLLRVALLIVAFYVAVECIGTLWWLWKKDKSRRER